MFFSKLHCLQNRQCGGIPSRAKQPYTWIQAKIPAWKVENVASIWFISPFCRKDVDWRVRAKMAVQRTREESKHFLSPGGLWADMLGTHIVGLWACLDYAALSTCHLHNSISSRCSKLLEDIWVLKHGHSSLIRKENTDVTWQWKRKKKCHHDSCWAWMTEMKDGALHIYLALDFRF